VITHGNTERGEPIAAVTCDGAGCEVRIHAMGASGVRRAEAVLRPHGERHYCPGCRALARAAGSAQFPHPEHR